MSQLQLLANCLIYIGFAASCTVAAEPHGGKPGTGSKVGTASYYGDRFHGRRTASGERFNMNALTTVHAYYPFGTVLRVTNLKNDRSVQVRVNDRGPLPHGRMLDLSRRAAEELGFLNSGLAKVKVEVLEIGHGRRKSG